MLTLLKLGGSLITDKNVEASFRAETMRRVAGEIRRALTQSPENQLIIGHGSGSFGHFAAKKYGTAQGVRSAQEWYGFADVAFVASKLNALILETLLAEQLPVMRFQPSASVRSDNGSIKYMEINTINNALNNRLIPVVYGDVAFDDTLGGTITSTETIFRYLADQLPVQRIVLLGEVEGVFDMDGNVIPKITPGNFEKIKSALRGSAGTDVTGGMITKVTDMLNLVGANPSLQVVILDGTTPDLLYDVLTMPEKAVGTLISSN